MKTFYPLSTYMIVNRTRRHATCGVIYNICQIGITLRIFFFKKKVKMTSFLLFPHLHSQTPQTLPPSQESFGKTTWLIVSPPLPPHLDYPDSVESSLHSRNTNYWDEPFTLTSRSKLRFAFSSSPLYVASPPSVLWPSPLHHRQNSPSFQPPPSSSSTPFATFWMSSTSKKTILPRPPNSTSRSWWCRNIQLLHESSTKNRTYIMWTQLGKIFLKFCTVCIIQTEKWITSL